RKEWLFLVVNRDRDNDFVKQRAGPFYDIEMTIRHRIKAAGINRAPHDQETFNALALAFNWERVQPSSSSAVFASWPHRADVFAAHRLGPVRPLFADLRLLILWGCKLPRAPDSRRI